VTTPSGDTQLSNGVPSPSVRRGQLPAVLLRQRSSRAGHLTVQISGGTGDADLYTRFGSRRPSPPTTAGLTSPATTRRVPSTTPRRQLLRHAQRLHLLLGRDVESDVCRRHHHGVDQRSSVTGISALPGRSSSGSWRSRGQARVVFTISGARRCDLYVRRGRVRPRQLDCRPYLNGNNETCTFTNPVAGDYFVMLRGFAAYSGVT